MSANIGPGLGRTTQTYRARPGAWEELGRNDLLCDDEGVILARGVRDRTALATIRAHVGATGHDVLRQRTRYQRWRAEP